MVCWAISLDIIREMHQRQQKRQNYFEQVDEEVRNRLHVAENLNKSLLSDVRFLREKLERLKGSK